jgi:hypothetical protein
MYLAVPKATEWSFYGKCRRHLQDGSERENVKFGTYTVKTGSGTFQTTWTSSAGGDMVLLTLITRRLEGERSIYSGYRMEIARPFEVPRSPDGVIVGVP